MRINKLKFSNLNSLKGEFEIDFTDKKLTEDNIFAIIGNTGSGKSTILDAITLALFAKTARIDKITGTSNEMMNRDSSSCYSEVIFTTSNRLYSAYFGQRRSRNKKDGNLVMYKRELRDLTKNKVLSSNKTFEKDLMELINLTFDQFSRSVLLAQGDFNKFLEAKDDEKAKILEQITGTEIYTLIGVKIFSHFSQEKKKLEILDAQLESQNILSDEEKNNITNQIKINNEEILKIKTSKSQCERDLNYYNLKNSLEKKKSNLQNIIDDKDSKTFQYNEYKNQVDLNEKAKEPLAILNEIVLDNNSVVTLNDELTKLNNQLTQIETNNIELKNRSFEIDVEIEKNRVIKSKIEDLVKIIRPLDSKINELEWDNKHSNEYIVNLNTEIESLLKEKDDLKSSTIKVKDEITLSQEYVDSHSDDKLLVDNFSEIVSNNNLLKTTLTQQKDHNENKESLESDLKKQQSNFGVLKNSLATLIDNIKNFKDEIKDCDELNSLQVSLKSLENSRSMLDKLSSNISSYVEDELQLKKLDEQLKDDKIKFIDAELEKNKYVELYQKSELALNRGKDLMKLSAFANRVQDGSPCPLCGSIDHPQPIQFDESILSDEQKSLDYLKIELDKSIKKTSQFEIDLKINTGKRNELVNSLNKNKEVISTVLNIDNNFKTTYENALNINHKNIEELKEKISCVQNINYKINELEIKKSNIDDKIKSVENNIININNSLDSININISLFEKTLQTTDIFFNKFLRFKNIQNNELDKIKNAFILNSNIIDKKKIELDGKMDRISKINDEVNTKTARLNEKKEYLDIYTTKLNDLKLQRKDLFKDKDCDEEINNINKVLDIGLKQQEQINQRISQLDKQKSVVQNTHKYKSENLLNLESLIAEKNITLESLKKANGFVNTEELLHSKLENTEEKRLKKYIQEYDELNFKITAITDDIKSDEQLINNDKPKRSSDETKKLYDELNTQYDNLQQTLGNLREKLNIDSDNIKKIEKIKSEREVQKNIKENWEKLNAAVGSSDGKKFRALAQGITLDFLLNNSNNKLSDLSDRYSLIRSNNSSGSTLDIDVVDLYMNGIIRPVNNLSGGEKFLVSLSLALGLCELVNSENPSETLFLDEGFGTLDEDTLDNALNTLMILSEKENKLIGIISHVQKVKDAISHKIIVEKNGDGSSNISGVGVK